MAKKREGMEAEFRLWFWDDLVIRLWVGDELMILFIPASSLLKP